MSNNSKFSREKIRVIACQKDFPNPTSESLERILKKSPKADFFVSSEHSFMIRVEGKLEEDPEMMKFLGIATKYETNLILCGIDQVIDGKTFCSCVFFSRLGKIYSHFKKDNSRLQHQGSDDGIFPSEYGNIGILICVEIEDHINRQNCLSGKPVIIFNPAYINCTGENPVFKRCKEMISSKLARCSQKNRCVIVRVDTAYPNGMASSMVICPDHTFFFPKHLSSVMYYEFSLDFRDNFQSFLTAPILERSYEIDNVGNRYLTHNFDKMRPTLDFSIYDDMMTLVTLHKKRVCLWNFNTLKETRFLQRLGRFAFAPNSRLITSKKDSLIGCFSTDIFTCWNSRTGKLIMDIENLKKRDENLSNIQKVMINGKIVSSSKSRLFLYEKNDLKFSHSYKLGEKEDEEEKEIVFFDPKDDQVITTFCRSQNSIERYDLRFPEKPVQLFSHSSPIRRIKMDFFNPQEIIHFSDDSGSLYQMKFNGEIKKFVDEFQQDQQDDDGGIQDFLCFSNSSYCFMIDSREKKLNVFNHKERKIEYTFKEPIMGIEDILFNGKHKMFVRSPEFVRIFEFKQNRNNIFLGNLLQ